MNYWIEEMYFHKRYTMRYDYDTTTTRGFERLQTYKEKKREKKQ